MTLPTQVVERIGQAYDYVQAMRRERQGYGPKAMREADATAASLLDALARYLSQSEQVWTDGPSDTLSFGGVIWGITYGMIARREPQTHGIVIAGEPVTFQHDPITWTFHS